ncbi:distal tail protein Dit [Clostridium perfringens]|uniref:Phage tail protein n=2 Tax=Clostridium perfringens TaxID=1502 RepID=A0AAP6WN91_CLOPF|nr:distal tail protein Dit [Clostridium perfringens]NP_612843.1 distal tail protein Dit [Clostridium phage phi3626]AAL96784.1 Gp14 protein [Clostridium phage phi3626]EDT22876.1 Gp14 protein [Clostridium perfringens B str. ATCC 3626]NGU30599.1 phage tail protein [Clostridium perfringens]WEV05012.1 phage tail family protein [Clostridium perfringens B]
MIDLIFNNKSLRHDFKVSIVKRPPTMFSIKNKRKVEVLGGDGDLYLELGGQQDITIPVECNFICSPNEIRDRFRLLKSWLNNVEDDKLIFTDDHNWFYKVVDINISSMDVIKRRKGKFTINFICRGYHFKLDGDEFIDIFNETILFNEYDLAKPLILLRGNGTIEVDINSNKFEVEVNEFVYIDSELEVAYKYEEDSYNLDIGDYPVLIHGENLISYKGNLDSFEIKCRWRCV